jgi:hypothetical protein
MAHDSVASYHLMANAGKASANNESQVNYLHEYLGSQILCTMLYHWYNGQKDPLPLVTQR